MTARNTQWLQNGTTSAEEDRAFLDSVYPIPGILRPGDLKVTQNGTPNMSVNVAPGRANVDGSESALQGSYLVWLDAIQNVVIAASDPTNPRIDLIVARVKDQQYSGLSNTFTVEAVTGTPAGSPVTPTAPANTYILATLAVAASVTTIVTANITDNRKGVGPFFQGWGPVAPVASAASTQAGISAVADLTGLTITFTAVAGRRYRVQGKVNVQNSAASASAIMTLCDVANTILNTFYFTSAGANGIGAVPVYHDTITPSVAGSYTFKLRLALNAGGGTVGSFVVGATGVPQLSVDDIGSATIN